MREESFEAATDGVHLLATPRPDAPGPDTPALQRPTDPDGQLPSVDDLESRRYSLGYDPAVGKFRETEAETALRVEADRGVTLARATRPDDCDWVDGDGRTYDAVGNFPARFFEAEWENLQLRVVDHLEKAQFVPVDISQFTRDQRSLVREFVDRFDDRVFVVGDE
ncbi:hypothetical protein [Kribbella sp. C-35]|uniref:hypothetical protein n=1 Tax=Kribbella sp. C-35 TaxID=2789276 RepID=UPI003978AB70